MYLMNKGLINNLLILDIINLEIMKKLILICLIAIGFMSFSSDNRSTSYEDTFKNVEINYDGWEVVLTSNTFDSDDGFYCCTSTVYYMGVKVTSFTCCGGYACTCAANAACDYIQNHGDTCPNQQ